MTGRAARRVLRAALVADSHFDEHNRFDECCALHLKIADDLARKSVDVLLHAGDLFERGSTARERNAAAGWVQRCAEVCPVIMVRGNHDKPGDLYLLGELETAHPVLVEEAAGVHVFGENADGEIGFDVEGLDIPRFAIACLAWPRKAELLAAISDDALRTPEASQQIAAEALRDVLAGMGTAIDRLEDRFERRVPRILLAHAMVTGSQTSTGQPLVGCDFEIGLPDLALARADVVALGHIHKGQAWDFGSAPIIYPGSPRRTAYGELEAKGYTLLDFYDDGAGGYRCEPGFVELPAQRMVLLEGDFDGVSLDWHLAAEPDVLRGADVRLRYDVKTEHRDAGKIAAAEVKKEMLEVHLADVVKVEEQVVTTVRARAAEVREAKTTAEKLAVFWKVKGITVDDEQRSRVFGKLEELERATA